PDRLDAVPEFRDRFLRVVRSDLRAVAGYRPDAHRPPLAAPLTAFGALHDSWAPLALMAPWARQTRGRFTERVYSGGHFHFLGTSFEAFTADVVEEIRTAQPLISAVPPSYVHPSV
ncbi:MAG: thioesterase II family protein, partial [Streptomyces sp.]